MLSSACPWTLWACQEFLTAMRAVCPLARIGRGFPDANFSAAIQAPSQAPQVHPHDRALLRPLATLGKPKVSGTSVSFLRRTEYISNANTTSKASPFLKQPHKNNVQRQLKRKSPEPEAGTPAYIKRKIEKGFDAARENLKDKSRVKHPTRMAVGKNRGLKVVEVFPVLPDLDAFPGDTGAYVTYKFAHPPISNSKEGYDKRLQTSVLRFSGRSPEEEEAYLARVEAYQRDPENNPRPLNQVHFELYLAPDLNAAEKFRAKFDLNNPNRDDESLNAPDTFRDDGTPCFKYQWARSYLSTVEHDGDHATKYNEELAFAIDPETKTAWYYPSMQRNRLEPPRRIYNVDQRNKTEIDAYEYVPVEPSDDLRARMDRFKSEPRWNPDLEEEGQGDADDASQDGAGSRRGDSEEPAGNGRSYSEDRRDESEQDAEGDEEE